jgi:hypothetical protein
MSPNVRSIEISGRKEGKEAGRLKYREGRKEGKEGKGRSPSPPSALFM